MDDSQLRPIDEALRERFEAAWRQGHPLDIEGSLPPKDDPRFLATLEELIHIDLEYAWKSRSKRGAATEDGCSGALYVEQHLEQFACLRDEEDAQRRLALQEFYVRHRFGDRPPLDEFADRFPGLVGLRNELSQALDDLPATGPGVAKTAAAKSSGESLGRYELRDEIGRGAFAVVYRAWDSQLEREVAIKLPRAELLAAPQMRERTMREARAAARLQHPAIVPVHEVVEHEQSLYIVSELVTGRPLDEALRDDPPSPEQVALCVANIADALDYAHQCGIVHRDIKPANILIRPDGQPVLMDFGLAHQADAVTTLTQEGDLLGTPAFMSPEQARGDTRNVTARSDVYSLGVVLYQLLCHRLPFDGHSASVLHRVLHEEPRKPTQTRPTVPSGLETICLKAMSKEPDRRYDSAGALAADLRRWLNHEPILARRVGSLGQVVLWGRRQPALAATMALSLVLLLSVAGFSYWRVVEERNRFRSERDRAQAALYRSLVSDTRSQLQARDTNWWFNALENLENAGQLDVGKKDVLELRDLAFEVLGKGEPWFRLVETWQGHEDGISSLVVIPPGAVLVSSSRDQKLRFWSIQSGDLLASVELPSRISAIAAHPDGQRMVTHDTDGKLRVWGLSPLSKNQSEHQRSVALWDQSRLIEWTGGWVTQMEFSPKGRSLALATRSNNVHVADVSGDDIDLAAAELLHHEGEVLCVGWSEDGRLLASGGKDPAVRLWDAESWSLVRDWTLVNPPHAIRVQGNGAQIGFNDILSMGYVVLDPTRDGIQAYPRLHMDHVRAILHTPFGWLTAADDGTLCVWAGRQQRAIARKAFAGVAAVAITPDKRYVLAGYRDGAIRNWQLDASPFQSEFRIQHRAKFLPEGKQLCVDDRVIDLGNSLAGATQPFDVPVFTAMETYHASDNFVCGTGDGRLLLFRGGDSTAKRMQRAGRQSITRLSVDPNDRWIVSASMDGAVKQWDATSLELLHAWQPDIGPVLGVSVSPDGRKLAASGRHGVVMWDLGQPDQPCWRESHLAHYGAIAFGEKTLAVPEEGGSIRVLDTEDFETRRVLRGHTRTVTALAVAPGNRLVSGAGDNTIRVWDLATGAESHNFRGPDGSPRWLACHPDGQLLAVGAAGVGVWRLPGGKPVANVTLWSRAQAGFAHNGSRLILTDDRGNVCQIPVAELSSERDDKADAVKLRTPDAWDHLSVQGGHLYQIWGVATSPDGRWIATTGHDQLVKIWDARTMQLTHTMKGHHDLVWCAAFSPDSKYLSTGSARVVSDNKRAGEIFTWDVATGQLLRGVQGHAGLVRGLAYDPRGRWLLSASNDGTIRVWDMHNGGLLGVLHESDQTIHDLAFSAGGGWLAAACHDNQFLVWDASDLASEAPDLTTMASRQLQGDRGGRAWAVAFSNDGRFLAGGTEYGAVTLWELAGFKRWTTMRNGERSRGIRSLSFSDDDSLLAVAAYVSSNCVVWDLSAARRRLHEMHLDRSVD